MLRLALVHVVDFDGDVVCVGVDSHKTTSACRYCLNKLHINPAHAVFLMYFMLGYCVFSWIYFFFNGYFFYFFLDFRRKFAFLAYLVIPVVLVVLHMLLAQAAV